MPGALMKLLRKNQKLSTKKLNFVYTGIISVLGFYALFFLFPLLYAGFLSVTSGIPGESLSFIGLENYRYAFYEDSLFWVALKNTLYFTALTLFPTTVLALLIAAGLNRAMKSRSILLPCYFAPQLTALVAVAVIFRYFYDPTVGLFNFILSKLRLPQFYYLEDAREAMPSIVLMCIWREVGWAVVIFLAGLQSIPEQYYEAAQLDGANRWQLLRRITLPLLSPIILFYVILEMVWCFQIFDPMYVVTPQGGPLHSTYTIVFHIYRNGFFYWRMPYACALTYVLFLICLTATIIVLRIGRTSWEY